MLLYDNWYVAALAEEIDAVKPLARTICGKPVVLYRTAEGRAVALEDRCIHRGMPLSDGKICESSGTLQCPYHGLEFDASGACVVAPGQTNIPRAMRVLAYPLVERDGFVWIWPGDPALAHESAIPVTGCALQEGWGHFGRTHIEYKADWQLLLDNLMDMNHIAFVHVATINGDPDAHTHAKMTVDADDEASRVTVQRHLPNCNPPAQYQFGYDFKGKIDRWQEFTWAPGGVAFRSGGVDAGTGAFEGHREAGVQLQHFHGITPSVEGETHYFFIGIRNFALDNAVIGAKMQDGMVATLVEDRDIIEQQQVRLNETPSRPLVSLAADAGGLAVRRVLARLHADERARQPEASAGQSGMPAMAQRIVNVDAMLQAGLGR
ncbi:aromatic ring-hydroxylating dioxygenase subunit alpha [Paraburkholderia sp. J67]|uniref:aromatic ring-hydroxylating dioxygenase subunit alpha n=1 Tax=Paraburkholderia sp. J67 TaxID=2805435 RepID=UPI002ABDFCF0|nr:aromatic ring-hydroxylating dioxygenase subunit alpha [Paraburkholderia sp. J67]